MFSCNGSAISNLVLVKFQLSGCLLVIELSEKSSAIMILLFSFLSEHLVYTQCQQNLLVLLSNATTGWRLAMQTLENASSWLQGTAM